MRGGKCVHARQRSAARERPRKSSCQIVWAAEGSPRASLVPNTTGSACFRRSRAGLHYSRTIRMHSDVKGFRTYEEQVELLVVRGMEVGDYEHAVGVLRRVNYYRLSGYWYPFRQQDRTGRRDDFYPGTRFEDVVSLYEFDAKLRAAAFSMLAPIELAIRALVGHELGRVDPCAHLDCGKLGPLRGANLARATRTAAGVRSTSTSSGHPARTSSSITTTSTEAGCRSGQRWNYSTGEP